MKYITLLILSLIPVSTFSEVLLGIMEESYLINKGTSQARILFSTNGENKWSVFDKDQLKEAISTDKLSWYVAFDGRNLGKISTAETDSSINFDKTFTYASRHKIDDIKKIPIIKNKQNRFGGWSYTPKNRPLILLTKPNYKDLEKWKRIKLKDSDKNKFIPYLKKSITYAAHCNGAPNYEVKKIKISNENIEFYKTYQNNKGERLVSIGIASHHIKECELPYHIDLAPQWFYVSKNIEYIGKNMDLIDAGDYDGDNQVEYLFWYSAYNNDGYKLFESKFSKQFNYLWKYH